MVSREMVVLPSAPMVRTWLGANIRMVAQIWATQDIMKISE
jgi:hypothetical protein